MAVEPTRRAVIVATAALPLLATGCRGAAALGTPPRPAPDVALMRDAIVAEDLMIARYQAAIRLHGGRATGAAATLARLLAEHEQHARQLRAGLIAGSPLAAGSRPLPRPTPPALPPGPRQALGYLSRAEQAAAQRLLAQVPRMPPAAAQLFASISASEATHVPALRAAGAVR